MSSVASLDYLDTNETAITTALNQTLAAASAQPRTVVADVFTAFQAATGPAHGHTCNVGLLNASPQNQFTCDIHLWGRGHFPFPSPSLCAFPRPARSVCLRDQLLARLARPIPENNTRSFRQNSKHPYHRILTPSLSKHFLYFPLCCTSGVGKTSAWVLHRNAASFFEREFFANHTFYCLALLHDNHAWSHRQTMEPFEKVPHIKVWQIAAHKNYVKLL